VTAAAGWILVVDDDEDIRDVVTLILQSHGYQAVGAFDGQDALDQLRRRDGAPALVLLDLMMPRLNGVDFAAEIRSRPQLRDVPIVILSGDSRSRETAVSLRAAHCLPKPVDLKDLLVTIRRLVTRS
jgi:chemosensory pili system protein ChpA (sensor histidine kinase/response regulator)